MWNTSHFQLLVESAVPLLPVPTSLFHTKTLPLENVAAFNLTSVNVCVRVCVCVCVCVCATYIIFLNPEHTAFPTDRKNEYVPFLNHWTRQKLAGPMEYLLTC